MEVKIINNKLDDYERLFKVRRMNYEQVLVNYPNEIGLKSFDFKDVECISESPIDDFLMNNRQYLKIKLKRGISIAFYNALKESIEMNIGEETNNLNVLIDKYKVNKRGIWDKTILILVNEKIPLEINANGQNFKKNYHIDIKELDKEYFISVCNNEIEKIEKEISMKNQEKISYKVAINHVFQ